MSDFFTDLFSGEEEEEEEEEEDDEDEEKEDAEEFLESFPTPLQFKRPESYYHFWVFWSQDHHEIQQQQQQQGFQIMNNNNDSISADVVDTRRTTISEKIKHVFSSMLKTRDYFDWLSIIQFWAPVTTIDGRHLLSASDQPFAVSRPHKNISKYMLRCVECQNDDDVNNRHPTATAAFLNRLPQAVLFKSLKRVTPTPLVDCALECGLMGCFMLPVCFPSQSTSSCIGVVEFSTRSYYGNGLEIIIMMIRALEEVGLGVFQLQQRIPSHIIHGFKPVKAEVEEALKKIACETNDIVLAQVWISFEDDNHVSFSSYLQGTPKKQMLSLKLRGYLPDTSSNPYFDRYYGLCDMFPLEMGEDFVEKTLEDNKPRFCNDVSKVRGDALIKQVFNHNVFVVSRLAICLNSIHPGDFCYAFEFIWRYNRGSDVKVVEELLLKLKELLPSFKLASGEELGDELDVIYLGDSRATKTKFLKIFQEKRLSPIPEMLEEGIRIPVPMVVDSVASFEAKYKTTPIPLSRDMIEQQFGNTEIEAAENLKVSRSTLRRKCRKLDILKWEGRHKRKLNDVYGNQSDTNEEDIGDTIQEPLSVNRNKHTLTIKAEYAGDMIKFRLNVSQTTLETVMEEIGTRFKLSPGTYKVKYLDEDKDRILLTSEQDMTDCIKTFRNSGVVRLHVEPCTLSITGPTN